MSNEQNISGSSAEQIRGGNWQTIGVLNLQNTPYLINEDEKAHIAFESINSNQPRQRTHYYEQAAALPKETIVAFKELEPTKTTIAQIGMDQPKIRWSERDSGFDEFSLSFEGVDAKKNVPLSVNISQREVMDLFLRPGTPDSASFFTLDTTSHSLIGIKLARAFPVLMTIVPGIEDAQFSSKVGLINVLDGIYTKLSERVSTLQLEVENKLIDVMVDRNGPLQFQYDNSSVAKMRQRQVHEYIYKIQAYLLALQAEENGLGRNDPALLSLMPFLQQPQTNPGGILGSIGLRPQNQSQTPRVVVDNTIWTSLVNNPVEVDMNLPEPQVYQTPIVSPSSIQPPIAQAAEPSPRPVVTPHTISPASRPAENTVLHPVYPPQVSERRSPQAVEKEKAVLVAQKLNLGLAETLSIFQAIPATRIGKGAVDLLNTKLDTLVEAAKEYMEQRHRGKPPENPTHYQIKSKPGALNIGGVKDENAFEFLTGKVEEENYKTKIEAAFQAWETYVKPIFHAQISDVDQKLNEITPHSSMWQGSPQATRELVLQMKALLSKDRLTGDAADVKVGYFTHILLADQILYTLKEYFSEMKTKGQSVEIDNWAHYCYGTVMRLRSLLPTQK